MIKDLYTCLDKFKGQNNSFTKHNKSGSCIFSDEHLLGSGCTFTPLKKINRPFLKIQSALAQKLEPPPNSFFAHSNSGCLTEKNG